MKQKQARMEFSKNPFTGASYAAPECESDRQNIETFLEKNRGKRVVVIQGLGFVGAVMSLVCANAMTEDYAVIGVDLLAAATYWRIRALNEGQFPLVADDPQIEELFQRTVIRGNFLATYDPAAYGYADVVIVDVNLDVQKTATDRGELLSFDVDLTSFKKAIQSIGKHCREDVLVLVETTVPPGTCQRVVRPIIDEELTRRSMPTGLYRLGHSYERVMPGPEYVDSIRSYPRAYSGVDDRSADAVEAFLRTIIDTSSCDLWRLGSTNATEMAKVLENSYRAINIAFMVEWSRFAEEAGVNIYEIVKAIRVRKTHANLMLPGIGVGGYCLTKDPLLASWSRRNFFGAAALDTSVKGVVINDQMPRFAFERLRDVVGNIDTQQVIVLGVSYRGDVGDTRFSPVELFVDCLESAGAVVDFHDPYVSYWPERQRTVHQHLTTCLAGNPSVVVIGAGHRMYANEATTEVLMSCSPLLIFDCIGLLTPAQIELLSTRHRVSVLGRGDF
jgi:UDP-N-acetyl-D-glucosamine dehydrogenase